MKLFVVILLISSKLTPFKWANLSVVYLIKLGSFFLPLIGSGAKKGLSVSTKIFSKGIFLIEDFGLNTYTNSLKIGESEYKLYNLATDILINIIQHIII